MINERDELVQALKDAGMPWDPVTIELPDGTPGEITDVRTAEDDRGRFIVVATKAATDA